MSDPADLINRAIEELQAAAIDLPAFSTLDRLVNSVRAKVHARIYDQVKQRLTADHKSTLDGLLAKPPNSVTTPFNRLKQTPGPATPKTIRLWIERLEWLTGLIDPEPLLEGVTHTKLRQFASEAAALEVNELLDISRPGKRHTLLLSLLRQARMHCRDELIEMMLRRIRRTQVAAKEQLEALHDQHREIEEALIGIFGQVLESAQAQETDAAFGHQVRHLLARQGGVKTLTEQVETVSAWHNKNDLPLLWPIHARYRNLLFQLLDLLDIRSATQDASLLDALSLVRRLRHARRDEVLDEVDLGFAAERWRRFVVKPRSEPAALDRRALEVCVFVHLAAALQAGDVYVVGSESFADYRAQLLPWAECEPRLAVYCAALRIPARGRDFAAALRRELTAAAAEVDAGFEANMELSIDPEGTPHLKQLATTGRPDGLAEFEQEVQARMPERHLLDILKNADTGHASRATSVRHPGPTRSLPGPSSGTCSLCSATAAIWAPTRPRATRPRSSPRRRYAGSTRSTSLPTSWKPPWST